MSSCFKIIKKNREFRRVFRVGRSVSNSSLVLYIRRNKDGSEKRFGFSVGKKVGKAVVRNRVKRLLKEICRVNNEVFPCGNDYVIIARKGAALENYHTLLAKLFLLLKKNQSSNAAGKASIGKV